MGPRPRVRTVCERIGERWRDDAGSLPTLGHPVTPTFVLGRGGCDLIFDCRETAMGPRNSHARNIEENANYRELS